MWLQTLLMARTAVMRTAVVQKGSWRNHFFCVFDALKLASVYTINERCKCVNLEQESVALIQAS